MAQVSDESLDKFIEISEKEGHEYKTREDARQAANNLVDYVDVLIQIDQEEKNQSKKTRRTSKGLRYPGERTYLPAMRQLSVRRGNVVRQVGHEVYELPERS